MVCVAYGCCRFGGCLDFAVGCLCFVVVLDCVLLGWFVRLVVWLFVRLLASVAWVC